MRVLTLIACSLLAFAPPALRADDGNPAYTDPATAPVDFKFQGEYLGSPDSDPGVKVGVQVVALGEGQFEFTAYIGGLPGAGWSRGDESIKGTGKLDGDTVKLASEGNQGSGIIKDGVLTVMDENGQKMGTWKKVDRTSPTLGAKPPEGAIVLFDGSTADTFENGKLVEDMYLGATNTTSKETFRDHKLHVEFRTPFMPKSRGQGRGNSGVYVQSRFEVQVLDSFGLEGKDNECGGLYSVGQPEVNMCFPPLSWQTYDIDFTSARYDEAGNKTADARITVRHNGVIVHDDAVLPRGTPGSQPEGAADLGLFLQDHGNPVVFRNIWAIRK